MQNITASPLGYIRQAYRIVQYTILSPPVFLFVLIVNGANLLIAILNPGEYIPILQKFFPLFWIFLPDCVLYSTIYLIVFTFQAIPLYFNWLHAFFNRKRSSNNQSSIFNRISEYSSRITSSNLGKISLGSLELGKWIAMVGLIKYGVGMTIFLILSPDAYATINVIPQLPNIYPLDYLHLLLTIEGLSLLLFIRPSLLNWFLSFLWFLFNDFADFLLNPPTFLLLHVTAFQPFLSQPVISMIFFGYLIVDLVVFGILGLISFVFFIRHSGNITNFFKQKDQTSIQVE